MYCDLAQSSKRVGPEWINAVIVRGWEGGEKGGKERGQFNFLTHLELVFSCLGRRGGV